MSHRGKYAEAMIAYTEAEKLLPELHDNRAARELYTEIGNIYRNNYDYSKCLEAYQTACDFYTKAGLESDVAYTLLNIGIA